MTARTVAPSLQEPTGTLAIALAGVLLGATGWFGVHPGVGPVLAVAVMLVSLRRGEVEASPSHVADRVLRADVPAAALARPAKTPRCAWERVPATGTLSLRWR